MPTEILRRFRILQAPGVQVIRSSRRRTSRKSSANGQRVSANNFQIDSVSVNSLSHGGAAVVTPNQESVKEIQISSSPIQQKTVEIPAHKSKLFHRMGLTIFGSAFLKYDSPKLNAFNKYQTILVVAEQNVSSASSGSLVAVSVDHSFCRGSVVRSATYNLRDRAFFFCLTKRYVRTQPRRRLLTSRHRSSGKPSSMHGPEESAPGYWPATAFNRA